MIALINVIKMQLKEVKTHLPHWLLIGYENCQYGSKEWCEEYLMSASQEISAARSNIPYLLAKIEKLISELEEVNDERDKLRGAIKNVITAWESVDEGYHNTEKIQRWLVANMAPALASARKAIGISHG